jgi:type II secretory pathway pseudopilin PulG
MSMTAKLVALGVIVLALLAGAWKVYHAIDKAGYTRAQAEYQAAAEAQRESNRGRTRVAEEKQAAQTIYRDRYITRTVKELDHAAQDLARCPLPPAAVRLFNDAARCAEQDRPASCGAGDSVPTSR